MRNRPRSRPLGSTPGRRSSERASCANCDPASCVLLLHEHSRRLGSASLFHAGPRFIALRANAARMEEDQLVLAQLIESGDDDVARRDQSRRRAGDETALLMPVAFEPRVEACEIRTAMIDLAIVMTDQGSVAHDSRVLRQLVAHARDV